MKAIAIDRYGDEPRLMDLPEPLMGPDQVLVRQKATGVNPADWKSAGGALEGRYEARFPFVLGWDVAGVVEQVGTSVTEFAVGDEVIAYHREDFVGRGTYAELVAVPARELALKPTGLSWLEAAALPAAGMTAYQAVRLLGVGSGDTLLVHAAAGGVGSVAVQVAKAFGARIIGTAGAGNHEYLHSLGAEPIAYGEGLADRVRALAPGGVDAVLDLVGGDTLELSPKLLAPGGRLASISPMAPEAGGRHLFVRPDGTDLSRLAAMVEAGTVKITVTRTYPLEEANEALRLLQTNHGRGKIVLTIDPLPMIDPAL
ncbi:NADP-dependent oxidoreductase [Streptomyces cellulosae]|uniref:NADP-dependent oxidoreductase n=1 Tax=Streptomyces cellulosae TaxID=1968 RepID=UPI0004CC0AA9|nr:NADP-dependent oxidoreductase [Streptomyces cellulosae]